MVNPNIAGQESTPRSPPELVVVTRKEAAVRATPEGVASASGAPISDLQDLLASQGAHMEPMFGGERPAGAAAAGAPQTEAGSEIEAEMAHYFHVVAPEESLESMAEQLRRLETVEAAYVKPPAEPARAALEAVRTLNEIEPVVAAPPSTTPNFTARQDHLDPAPVGIDAAYAWGLPGGRGQGIRIIDCEWGWRFTHEDLIQNSLGLVAGTNHTSTNHGTAVMGEIGGDQNSFGVTGIAAAALLGASSFTSQTTPTAIKNAADALSAGDIILLEIHRGGPNATGQGQKGYIAIEWWPDDFLAIRYAVNKGVVVVEAAGNGWENLDAAVYDTPGTGFPSWWKNPFHAGNPSSGAVIVGAGSPPSGTHGRTTSPWNLPYVDRARCGFSNWGSRVDAQGWGWEVTSTGYGDLQGGADPDRWYTDTFSGTSSASPIVTGALGCTQGVLKAKGMPLMTSQRARQLLRSTGSPQQPAPNRPVSQRIGNRPDLRHLIPAALKQWISNTVIRYTYALYTSQAAWAFVDGMGWRRVHPGSADGVSNVFRVCTEAQAAGTKVNVYIDETYLYNIIAL
ncbi:MAG TPA: S8 family serine peptidase [Longimicrobiales bacterium]|nr:S8 family serine peptidase [Longimicrobiales bacterium]